MPFTIRLLILLMIAPLLVALSWWAEVFALLAIIYVAILTALFWRDFISLPRQGDLEVVRENAHDLSLAAENPVTIKVRYRDETPVRAEFKDGIPPHFQVSQESHVFDMSPATRIELPCTLRPVRRGAFTIGPIYARFTSPWRLAERKMTFPLEEQVQVIPDVIAARKYDLKLKRGIVRKSGSRIMRLAGRGSEFESLRQYVPDDDPRHIDWKSTARHGKVLTRNFQPETKQRIILAIDLGRMMLGKFEDVAKVDSVLNAALLLTHAAIKMGDSVGFIGFSDELEVRMPTRPGKGQVNMLLRQVAPLEPRPVETDYRILSRELRSVERRRALVVVFTDFIDETQIDEMIQALIAVKRRHRVLVAAVRDVETYELAEQKPDSEREAFGAAAASHLLIQRKMAIKRLESAGIIVADLDQRELSMGVVERYLELRETAVF